MKRVIGIVGGMGPQAGIALFNSITAQTQAGKDQEHLPVIVMSFPGSIGDRTDFLEGNAIINPAFSIAAIIRKLELAGAHVVGIACNTSHAPGIFDVIKEELDKAGTRVNLLNMPFETCRYIRENYKQASRIGLMTTNGTYRTGVYSDLLRSWGYEPVMPDIHFQHQVIHKMVYDPGWGIKSNPAGITVEVGRLLDKAFCFFEERGADAVVLGCTEFSLTEAMSKKYRLPTIDSTAIMAKALIREAVAGSTEQASEDLYRLFQKHQ